MSDGDRVTQDGQLQIGSVLIDVLSLARGADATTNGAENITGLTMVGKRITDEDRIAGGSWANRRVDAARQVSLPWAARNKASMAAVLAALEPEDPATSRDLVWQGIGWPSGQKYRLGTRPGDASKVDFDRTAGVADWWDAVAVFDAADPLVYSFDSTAATITAGSSDAITSPGNRRSARLTLDMWGPWTGPGLYVDEHPELGVSFPDVTLGDTDVIHVICDPHDPLYGFGSFTVPDLWAAAKGPAAPTFGFQSLPRIVPGDSTLVATGTGTGTVTATWFDAFLTPQVLP